MSEKDEAEHDGATLNKNSGRGWIQKGDAILGEFCVDYKEYAKSFSVSRTVWAKVTKDAFRMRKSPALKLVLGKGKDKLRLWVIDDTMFHEMYDAWVEKYGEPVTNQETMGLDRGQPLGDSQPDKRNHV
jgi:hypothetical protein